MSRVTCHEAPRDIFVTMSGRCWLDQDTTETEKSSVDSVHSPIRRPGPGFTPSSSRDDSLIQWTLATIKLETLGSRRGVNPGRHSQSRSSNNNKKNDGKRFPGLSFQQSSDYKQLVVSGICVSGIPTRKISFLITRSCSSEFHLSDKDCKRIVGWKCRAITFTVVNILHILQLQSNKKFMDRKIGVNSIADLLFSVQEDYTSRIFVKIFTYLWKVITYEPWYLSWGGKEGPGPRPRRKIVVL